MDCQCGCGEEVSTASFKPGHDQKLRISLEKRAGGIERLRELVEASETESASELYSPQECRKESDEAFKRVDNDQAEYDKQLLTLSSGFLAVSLAFIKDVVPLKDADFIWLLYISFSLLAFCILLVLFSYQFSISGNMKVKDYWDSRANGSHDRDFPMAYARIIKWLNRVSGLLFGLGVCSLVLFVILNLNHEANMKGKTIVAMDGAHIKVPQSGDTVEKGAHIKVPVLPAKPQAAPTSNSSNGNQSK